MPDETACPESDRLAGLLGEARPPADLLGHLGRCPRCRNTLDEIAVGGAAWLRWPPGGLAVRAETSPHLRRVLEEAGRLTPPADGPPGADPDLGLLAPSAHPGALGAVGPYPVLGVVGRGGMGVVFQALDPALGRPVAVKVLSPRLGASETARHRFVREAKAAAAVVHEHVVGIHAVAEADGLPFLVMEFVPGPSLQDRLDRDGPLDPLEAAEVARQVAEGLAAAHARGLVHRDVKPANILLGPDGRRARLTDFGLARAVDDAGCTHPGTIAGTPEYMAPEQAGGGAVDHRADLYSLGCVLYAACTGRPPFRAATSLGVLHQAATASPVPVRAVRPGVPPALAAVTMRLLARNPADRFDSAGQAAAELRGVLAGGVGPGPPAPGRRPPRGWAVAAAVAGAIGTALVFAPPGGVSDVDPGGPGGVEGEAADRASAREGAPPLSEVRAFEGHTGPVRGLVVHPDGRRMASASGWPGGDGTLRVWDLRTGREECRVGVGGQCNALAVSPDGGALVAGLSDGTVRVLDWEDGCRERLRLGASGSEVTSVAVSPDGRRVAAGTLSGDVTVWDAGTGEQVLDVRAHSGLCRAVAYAPDGRTFATGGADGAIRFWDAAAGSPAREIPVGRGRGQVWVPTLAFAGGGTLVEAGDGAAVWDLDTRRPRAELRGHRDGVTQLAVSPDGARGATASYDGTACLWDLASGRLLGRAEAGVGVVWAIAFTPDGGHLLTGGGGVWRQPQAGGPGGWAPGSRFVIRMWGSRGAEPTPPPHTTP